MPKPLPIPALHSGHLEAAGQQTIPPSSLSHRPTRPDGAEAATQMRQMGPPIVPCCHAGRGDRTITAAATGATVTQRRASQSNHVGVKHWQMQGGTLLKHRGITSAAPNPCTPSCDTVLYTVVVLPAGMDMYSDMDMAAGVREFMTPSSPGSASATFPAAVTNAIASLDNRLGQTRL